MLAGGQHMQGRVVHPSVNFSNVGGQLSTES